MLSDTRLLTFDVFGTVVDWRSSVTREGQQLAAQHDLPGIDWNAFALAWRGRYGQSMAPIRDGSRDWVRLDILHRENLVATLAQFGIDTLTDSQIDHFNRAWHRLDPWPDSVPGLTRLKTRFTLATLSNGNIELMVNMAKHSGLPWDVVLGAETARQYKPHPEVYRSAAEIMGLAPEQCCMVAAHPADLAAAAAVGFRTAYIHRPDEHVPGSTPAMPPTALPPSATPPIAMPDVSRFDIAVTSLEALADQLNC